MGSVRIRGYLYDSAGAMESQMCWTSITELQENVGLELGKIGRASCMTF
jgi:hypothetical protein